MSDTSLKVKLAPNSKESEMMVLGLYADQYQRLEHCIRWLVDTDFYYTEHKMIFLALKPPI